MTITGCTLNNTDPSGVSLFDLLSLTPGSAAAVDGGVMMNGVIDADGEHGSVSNLVLTTELFGAAP